MNVERIATRSDERIALALDERGFAHAVAGGARGLFYLTNATGAWTRERIAGPTESGTCANFVREPAIAIDPDGTLWAAFTRECRNGVPTWTTGLYAMEHRGGAWREPERVAGKYHVRPSLVARSGRVHLAYAWNGLVQRPHEVFYATRSGGEWSSQSVALDAGSPSLALDADGHPRIAYSTEAGGRYAVGGPDGQFTATPVPVAEPWPRIVLRLDSHDRPHVAWTGYEPRHGLNHAHLEEVGWTVSAPVAGAGLLGMAIDRADNLHLLAEVYLGDESGLTTIVYLTAASGDLERVELTTGEGTFSGDLVLASDGTPHAMWLSERCCPFETGLWYGVGPASS